MTVCAACGADNPAPAKFCMACGAALAAPPPIAEERKVVTTLFCDLVGFTAMSEAADPEDVDALLGRYHEAARKLIESHGGIVEKFIGDAVVGVFGVPAVHEDDPERAVRTGLRLLEALGGLTRPDGTALEARVGVNTGEAFVRLDVGPSSGRGFLAGDAVNVAARLQAAAPPNGVAVGALTHERTISAIEYEKLPPMAAKGKREPVVAYRALRPFARTGLRTTGLTAAPLLGRAGELAALHDALGAALRGHAARFVLLVGEPGIGKSRLVLEFARSLDERPEMVTWRQGRCSAYGDSAGLAALAEILKAHAAILDSDEVAAVEEKLEAVLPEGDQRPWLKQRLHPLLGLEAAPASQEESFAAWTQFLRHLASTGPTILVLEDLHWAGEGLLAFVEHLAAQELEAPLLVLATTRPELLTTHPDTLAPSTRVSRLTLAPLSEREAGHLVSALLDGRLAADLRAPILERVGGNPLYAEEYVRLLLDRGLVFTSRGVLKRREGEDLPLPDTVQAVLAARLDTLPPSHKALLCDAAVFGETFWAGGVAALGGCDPSVADDAMRALAERQLVRTARSSSLAGEVEYLFWHALTRDVAYEQLPRKARARKHEDAAGWLEAAAGDRSVDLAETLAHHYMTALELARACGEKDREALLISPAIRYLTASGDLLYNADLAAAERYYRTGLDLAPAGTEQAAVIRARLGEALLWSGRLPEAEALLEDAVSGLRLAGDVRGAAVATVCLARAHENGASDIQIEDLYRDAMALLENDGPSPELVRVLTEYGRFQVDLGEVELGLAAFERSLVTARAIGAPEPALALILRGCTLGDLGMPGCQADFRRSLELAQQQGLGVELGRVWLNYCAFLNLQEGPGRALEELVRTLGLAESRGLVSFLGGIQAMRAEYLVYAGCWKEAIAEAERLDPSRVSDSDAYDLLSLRLIRWLALAWRGQLEGTRGEVDLVLQELGAFRGTEAVVTLLVCAVAEAQFSLDAALQHLKQMLTMNARGAQTFVAYLLPEGCRIAVRGHDLLLAERLRSTWQGSLPVEVLVREDIASMLAEARGDHGAAAAGFADVAARWHGFGVPYEEAQALLGQGRCLAALGRAPEAAPALQEARAIFLRLGAKPALEETDALLRGV